MLPHTIAKIILVCYLVLAPLLLFASYKFIKSTDSSFDAPKGTLVYESENNAGNLMTSQIFHNPLFFTIQYENGSAVIYDGMDMKTSAVCELGDFIESLRVHPETHHTPGIVSVKWYCAYAQFPAFSRQLVSEDNKTALVAVDLYTKGGLLGGGSTGPSATIDAVHEFVDATLSKEHPGILIKSTSVEEVFGDLKNGLLADLLVIDSVAIPLATAALALCLRSTRMLIIPLPSVVLSVTLTFSILYPIALHTSVSSFAPEFCMGALIALTIDYSLFILSRFKERVALTRLGGKDLTNHAVQAKIVYDTAVLTAENIVVSGMTVAIALGMLLIVPISTVATIGGAYALGALCTIFVSLTFQPSLLLVFFEYFSYDPCFNIVFKYAPFMKKYFAEDLYLEGGVSEEDDHKKNLEKKSAQNSKKSFGKFTVEDNNNNNNNNTSNALGRAVPTSVTLDDTANYKSDSDLTHNNNNNNNNNKTPNKSNTVSQDNKKRKSQSDFSSSNNSVPELHAINVNNNNNNSSSNSKSASSKQQQQQKQLSAPPTYNTLFEKEDLIQYRTSQIRMSTPTSSNSNLQPGSNDNNNNNSEREQQDHHDGDHEENDDLVNVHQLEAEGAARRAQYRSFWFKLGRWVIAHPYLTLIVVMILGAPFCWMSSRVSITFDMFLQVPEGSVHVQTLFDVANNMGTGSLSAPFYVTVDTGRPNGVASFVNVSEGNGKNVSVFAFNAAFWTELERLVQHLHVSIPQPLEKIMSFVSIPGASANFSFDSVEGDILINCARAANFNDSTPVTRDLNLCLQYQLLYNQTVDKSMRMALILLAPKVNPFGTESYDYVTDINNAVLSFQINNTAAARGGADQPPLITKLGFFGASSASWAILHKMIELLPLQLGLMFLVIFIICFAVFRSIFVPIRMILTVAFPVAIALGTGAIFFQVHPLNDMWSVPVTAYSWLVPEFAFTLLCALALDYDIFLITRVVEYKKLGFTNEAALSKAVYKSSRTIGFAGIIMCFSFGGMMFSNVMMMVQFGFVATIAVLIDTFLMRPIVVPALMTVVPQQIVWFPRSFGPNADTRDCDDMTEARGVHDEIEDAEGENEEENSNNNNNNDKRGETEGNSGEETDEKMSSNLLGRQARSMGVDSTNDGAINESERNIHQVQSSSRKASTLSNKNQDDSHKKEKEQNSLHHNEFDYGSTS